MINALKRKYRNLAADKRFSEILTGSVWALMSRVFAMVFGLIASIIITRIYGAEVMGIVAVINSFLLLTSIFTVLGTGTSILRLIPEHIVKYSATSAFRVYLKTQYMVVTISIITSVGLFFSVGLISDKIFSKPHLSYYLALAAVFVVFKSLSNLNTEAVRGLRMIKAFSFMQILPSICNLSLLGMLTLFAFNKDNPIYALLISLAITGILGWILMQLEFKKKMHSQDIIGATSIRNILSISLPMLMADTSFFLISQTGIIILAMFRSDAEVGYYAIAIMMASLTSFNIKAINSIAAPKFSELFHSGKIDEMFYVAQKSAKLIFWTTAPILIGLVILGKLVLTVIYGSTFVIVYPAIAILAIGQFISAISGITASVMNMTGNQSAFRNIMFLAALMNICISLLLIPDYGINGAAFGAMCSVCFWNISSLFFIKNKYGKITGYVPLLKSLGNYLDTFLEK